MTHYETLRVQPNASQRQIDSAYRILAAELHPDVNSRPDAAEQFKRLKAAYDVLRDASQRSAYDAMLRAQARREPPQEPKRAAEPPKPPPPAPAPQRGRMYAVAAGAAVAGGVLALMLIRPPAEAGAPPRSDGSCPDSAAIKGNIGRSGERIFHVPGGEFYMRTHAERCFGSGRDAEAAGFRASQR